jgi:hypothetical protein
MKKIIKTKSIETIEYLNLDMRKMGKNITKENNIVMIYDVAIIIYIVLIIFEKFIPIVRNCKKMDLKKLIKNIT